MPFEYIWTVSANGVACRIPSPSDPSNSLRIKVILNNLRSGCISEIEWKEIPCSDGSAICTIVASPTSAFAIDRSGRVLILVLPTHLAIRERAEIYNNQVN